MLSISHIFFPKEFDQRFLLRSDAVGKKDPQRDTEEDETEGVLQEKLGAKCPIKKPSIRRMTKPAINAIGDELVVDALVKCNRMGEIV